MIPALLTAVDATSHIHLIIGSNPLAAARCSRSLEVGAHPKLITPADSLLHYGLQKRIEDGQVTWLTKSFSDTDLSTLGRPEVDGIVDAVFVTLPRTSPMSVHISNLCRRLRIPVNVADAPNLCSFTLLSVHADGPLQIGITTSGKGCKLASRIRREVVSALPPNLGTACERLGNLRRRIWEEDHAAADLVSGSSLEIEEDEGGQKASFNQLIINDEDRDAAKNRRMRWLSQICEYWPLSRLAAIDDEDVDRILHRYRGDNEEEEQDDQKTGAMEKTGVVDPAVFNLASKQRLSKPKMVLAGSGPGHPDLLTTATHKAILHADLVLADKLVPEAVLALVPRRATIYIARKFPGNADRAQEELLQMGLEGLKRGQNVVRLKQGDPYLYGRGAEEYAFFNQHGFEVVVIPGITSALSAPVFAGIPPTHRAVADQVLVCTGTGRKGAAPDPPGYRPARTVVFLMALHRLSALVESLVENNGIEEGVVTTTATKQKHQLWRGDEKVKDQGLSTKEQEEKMKIQKKKWPKSTPCAVIERASCQDQRVIRTTLEYVCAAVEEEGSRPPGLLVVGRSCRVLHGHLYAGGDGVGGGDAGVVGDVGGDGDGSGDESKRNMLGGDGDGDGDGDTKMIPRWVVEEGYKALDSL
ncbi:MAG: hypothetical protein M1823_003145 [Watsoniomyces obsoletus]|nr:MAG: hypothetical protein M1823_003145 [Watsoniomyces obsoletus]